MKKILLLALLVLAGLSTSAFADESALNSTDATAKVSKMDAKKSKKADKKSEKAEVKSDDKAPEAAQAAK